MKYFVNDGLFEEPFQYKTLGYGNVDEKIHDKNANSSDKNQQIEEGIRSNRKFYPGTFDSEYHYALTSLFTAV